MSSRAGTVCPRFGFQLCSLVGLGMTRKRIRTTHDQSVSIPPGRGQADEPGCVVGPVLDSAGDLRPLPVLLNRASAQAAQAWVEGVAQGVAQQVYAQHGEAEREAGEEEHPGR